MKQFVTIILFSEQNQQTLFNKKYAIIVNMHMRKLLPITVSIFNSNNFFIYINCLLQLKSSIASIISYAKETHPYMKSYMGSIL